MLSTTLVENRERTHIVELAAIFVINLPSDEERWARTVSGFTPAFAGMVRRVGAVRGSDIPYLARSVLSKSGAWAHRPGEIGCFVSHVKAWEAVSAMGGWCAVLEDDAASVGFERVTSVQPPPLADIIFMNDRMSPGQRSDSPQTAIQILDISCALLKLNQTGRGVGGDGYLLTSSAATKLLQAVSDDGFFGHVDWRLLRYSVTEQRLLKDFRDTRVERVLRHDVHPHCPPSWGILNAYVLSHPLIGHAPAKGVSRRIEENAFYSTTRSAAS